MIGSWHLIFREQNLRRKIVCTDTEVIETCMLNLQEKSSREKTDNRKMPYLHISKIEIKSYHTEVMKLNKKWECKEYGRTASI